jgi:anti-anti-sigma factor
MNIDTEQQNDLCIVRCKGRLIAGPDLDYMHSKMDDIRRLNCSRVLLDFREVPAIGSLGVSFIVGLYTSMVRRPGGRFILAGVAPMVRHVLDLTRLNTVIPIAPDVESGLAALSAPNSSAAVLSNASAG